MKVFIVLLFFGRTTHAEINTWTRSSLAQG